MSIELNNVASGYSTGVINTNFQLIEDFLNNNVLKRDGVEPSDANHMNTPLDMNHQPILNFSLGVGQDSLLTVGVADDLYVNVTGDEMEGPLLVREPELDEEPVRVIELNQVKTEYQAADANLQAQISGTQPLEASAFSPISWHKQEIENSVTIPPNQNAWSFGPTVTVASGQTVTISNGSYWTIASGEGVTLAFGYDGGEL